MYQKKTLFQRGAAWLLSISMLAGNAQMTALAAAPEKAAGISQTITADAQAGPDGTAVFSIDASLYGPDGTDASALYKLEAGEGAELSIGLNAITLDKGDKAAEFLGSDQYNLTEVLVPAEEKGRDYQVFYSADAFAPYSEYATSESCTGNTAAPEDSFVLPEGTQAVYIRYSDLWDGNLSFQVSAQIAPEISGDLNAYAYLYDPCGLYDESNGIAESYGADLLDLKSQDEAVFGKQVLRTNAGMNLRPQDKLSDLNENSVSPKEPDRTAGAELEAGTTHFNGWEINAMWGTLSYDYTWNTASDEYRMPKIITTYRIENASREYAPGSIQFEIPGIGGSTRAGMVKADSISADSSDSEWSYTWDSRNDIYTFRNKFTVAKGESTSGGFELLWDFQSRKQENGYSMEANPRFSIMDGDNAGTTALPPLRYSFQSSRDRYQIDFYQEPVRNYVTEIEEKDQNYVWYPFETWITSDYLARGLYKSDYFVSVEIDGLADEGYAGIVAEKNGSLIPLQKIIRHDGSEVWGFYSMQGRFGDLCGKNTVAWDNFFLGFSKGTLNGKTAIIRTHLDRLYEDEADWTRTAGENETVDGETRFTIEAYDFTYSGHIYAQDKWNSRYEYSRYDHKPPYSYGSRLLKNSLFDGTEVDFKLEGRAMRNFGNGQSSSAGILKYIPPEQIDPSKTYDLIQGDDWLSIYQVNGKIRKLTDSDYDMKSVTVSADARRYDYDVYYAKSSDAPFNSFVLAGSGNTVRTTTIYLPEEAKACYVRVKNAYKDYWFTATVRVSLHLDKKREDAFVQEGLGNEIDPEGKLANFSYLMAFDTGKTENSAAVGPENYLKEYADVLRPHDQQVFGGYVYRDYSHVWLRDPMTRLSADTNMDTLTGSSSSGFTSTVHASGSISADDPGMLTRFSLYSEIPAGCSVDLDEYPPEISGSGTFQDGSTAQLKERSVISTKKVGDKTFLVVDFDYSDSPLEIKKTTSLRVSYKVFLSPSDYRMSQATSYTTRTYVMAHDEGLSRFWAANLVTDSMDLDGDGNITDKAAYKSYTSRLKDSAVEWRELANKFVQSYYSNGFGENTWVRMSHDTETDPELKSMSEYEYRLFFGLGAANAKNIWFYDNLEQGSRIAADGTYKEIPSEWQGSLVSVDTSRAQAQGMKATVYYSDRVLNGTEKENGQLEFAIDSSFVKASDWTRPLSDVRSIAVQLDTSSLRDGWMAMKGNTYVSVRMQAPNDQNACKKQAVNQYYVQYDSYDGLLGEYQGKHTLPSSDTRITLLESLVKLTLKKTDAGRTIPGKDGTVSNAPLSGASFNIYDSDKKLIAENCKVNGTGEFSIKYVTGGTYYWEEVETPAGYVPAEGLHEFTISEADNVVEIPNERIPGSVTLTKNDKDHKLEYGSLKGASFHLYTSSGEIVRTDPDGRYTEDGTIDTFTTDESGTLTVTGLPWGSYYFKEIQAPEGYDLSTGRIEFMISRYDSPVTGTDGALTIHTNVEAFNTEKKASAILIKKDAETGEKLKDAYFELYRKTLEGSGTNRKWKWILEREAQKTNAAGEIAVQDLNFGTYRFAEVQPPRGYLMDPANGVIKSDNGEAEFPEDFNAKELEFTLDASTVGKTIELTTSNERRKGSAALYKTSEDGIPLQGAVFSLYKENGAEDILIQENMATDLEGMTPYAENLEWGDYYFQETEAPKGYEINPEPFKFSLTANNVEIPVRIKAQNGRITGSVTLVKKDEETGNVMTYQHDNSIPSSEKQPGAATFGLFTNTGTRIGFHTTDDMGKYIVTGNPEEDTNMVFTTGEDGMLRVSGLDWGSYYFEELEAPLGYGVSRSKVRFSINSDNCTSEQTLECFDPVLTATIRVEKEINDWYKPFGQAEFLFRVSGTDLSGNGHTFYKTISLGDLKSGYAVFTVPAGTYTVEEISASRYKLVSIDGDTSISQKEVTLKDQEEVTVRFVNRIDQYENASHTSSITNLIAKGVKPTSLTAVYSGPVVITPDSEGANEDGDTYRFTARDLVGSTVSFDDGTTRSVVSDADYMAAVLTGKGDTVIRFSDLVLNPEKVTGENNDNGAGYTIEVSYTKNRITVKDSFSVQISLNAPKEPFRVVYDANGGYFGDLSMQTNEVTYQKTKTGITIINGTEMEPEHVSLLFAGWYTDAACTDGNEFVLENCENDITVYAKWIMPPPDVKYAVSVYGIMHDTYKDENGNTGTAGLTFGPATGKNYVNTFKAHTPTGNTTNGNPHRCIHNDDWPTIISWSQKDPYVYEQCIDGGGSGESCTKSVPIVLSEKIKGTSYSNMSGDGAGMLYESINLDYLRWNAYKGGSYTNKGGWPASRIRSTLNGRQPETTEVAWEDTESDEYQVTEDKLCTEADSLFSGFPAALKEAIVSKAVKSDTVYNDVSGNNVVTYDKLWLFSGREVYGDSDASNVIRPNEGIPYERITALGITTSNYVMNKGYYESGSTTYRWLRSESRYYSNNACSVGGSGGWYNSHVSFDDGLAPGFCLPGPEPDVKYAVSVYGVMHDAYMKEDGTTGQAGLTFGPASGASFMDDYISKDHNGADHSGATADGNTYRCIHDDTWTEIAEWSRKDPYVYEKCMGDAEHLSCTKAVPLYLSNSLKGEDEIILREQGDGASTLYSSIFNRENGYRLSWNMPGSKYFDPSSSDYQNGTTIGGWQDSLVRNTLNGTVTDNMIHITNNRQELTMLTETESLLGTFPDEIRNEIVPKEVKSICLGETDKDDKLISTYDKLWLLSISESTDIENEDEGQTYERQKLQQIDPQSNKMILYDEYGSIMDSWLRTTRNERVQCISRIGFWTQLPANGLALAPGFCFPGPELKPNVKYAVSVYGIEHDTYKDKNGKMGTAGLTFGPATGKSYVNTFKAHTPTGNTASGNPHRCIHNDNWSTIVFWSQKDPYVYEQCIDGGESGESCTKAVPLYLNNKLRESSFSNMTGDGAGMLNYSITSNYRKWNLNNTNQGGWPDAAVRNTLNGTVTDNMLNVTNKDNEFEQVKLDEKTALISCFPIELRNAIVLKEVKSDTVYDDSSSNNTITYDKLWLLSIREAYSDSNDRVRPNEGKPYARTTILDITTSNYSKNKGYTELGFSSVCWLRSVYAFSPSVINSVSMSGKLDAYNASDTYCGLAPGFCLK